LLQYFIVHVFNLEDVRTSCFLLAARRAIMWAKSALFRLAVALVLAIALSAPLVHGQAAATGTIVGRVEDDSGGVLPGVTVVLSGENVMGGTRSSTTDERGTYRFASLHPGLYDLTFTLSGFATARRTEVRVLVGAVVEENVILRVAGFAEEVTVVSQAVVDTKTTKLESTYDREWIDNAPIQRRSFFDILAQGPGIDGGESANAASGQGARAASFGSNVDQNLYQIDGVDVSDHAYSGGTTHISPSIDTIEQVQILALGAPAEYGSHEGAVFNVVTRQGTNNFHGSVAYFNQSDALTSRNTTEDFDGGNPFDRIKFHNVTAQLGGPILLDKWWFFGAYELLRDSFALLRPPSTAPETEFDHYFLKQNFQPKPGHQFMGLVNYDDRLQDLGLFPEEAPETAAGTSRKVWTTSLSYTGALSGDTLVEAQYAGFYMDFLRGQPGGGAPVIGTRIENLATGELTGAPAVWYDLSESRTSLNGKLSHYAGDFLNAGHAFKFGVQFSKAPIEGTYGVNDVVYTNDFLSGYGYDYTPYRYGGNLDSLGVFLDDSITVGDRLQINAGLRYDYVHAEFTDQPVLDEAGVPTNRTIPGFDVYTWNTVAPRLGFNLQLTDDGRTVLKSHYGRYYRPGSTGEWVAIASPTRVVAHRGDWNFQTGRFENTEVSFSPSNAAVDPDFSPGRTDQFVVSIERELFKTVNLSASYILKRGRNLSNWTDVGGVYEPFSYVDNEGAEASGDTLTLFRLVNSPADRRFLLTTGENTRADADAFSLTATRRMTSDWQLTGSLTFQKATSANTYGQAAWLNFRTFGRDPNDYVNSEGRAFRDRDVIAKAQFLHNGLPLGISLGVDWTYYTGYPTRRTVRVPATGIGSTVQTEPRTDDKRYPGTNVFNLLIEKDFQLKEGVRLGLRGSIFNLFNNDAVVSFRTDLATSALYHQPSQVLPPRRAMLGVKLTF
jgi:outer membrane receptor protein involved in Fe transport